MKKIILSILMLYIGIAVFGQKTQKETIVIQTNGVCEQCKTRFEENIPYLKGVTDVSYDLKSSRLTVTFNKSKTTADDIRKKVSNLGYDADQVKANPEARAKLPACCRTTKNSHGCSSSCGHHQ